MDGNPLEVEKGSTILQVAEQNSVYIPTLCTHKELTPFGACRMCVVEVEGMRGYPAACTTPVTEGMEIKTNSKAIHSARVDVLQLILSEHPSSCLICNERVDCKSKQGTVRKAGVTTGCRYCPSDGQCELQDVAEHLNVEELSFPIRYRGIPVTKGDPFMDRDYNLCILCGRCVRVCGELRGSAALAFLRRGSDTIVGAAYDCDQIDAGCEFCGDCIAVCPTGALSEKVKKWDGAADSEEVSTCPLCGIGCQLQLLVKDDEVIGSLPVEDPVVSDAQLCVKGRFCLTELVNDERRLVEASVLKDGASLKCSLDDAIGMAAEKLSECGADDFGMVISANCSSEDLYIAQKFARVAMGSDNIDTDARRFYGRDLEAYVDLLKMPGTLADIRNAQVAFCVGLDVQFAQSVVNVELRKAAARGARIITLNPRANELSISSDLWLKPQPGTERKFIEKLLGSVAVNGGQQESQSDREAGDVDAEILKAATMLRGLDNPVIVIGTEVLQRETTQDILISIKQLAEAIGAKLVVLPPQNNLFGSLLMGANSGLLPGGFSALETDQLKMLEKMWGVDLSKLGSHQEPYTFSTGQKTNVTYLVGDGSPVERPVTDFLIYQNIYPALSGVDPDLNLPSAAFTEVDGTFVNGEGRIQRVRKAVDPPGEALPDWDILCRIARKMGKSGFDFNDSAGIHKEMSKIVAGYGDVETARLELAALPAGNDSKTAGVADAGDMTKENVDEFPFVLRAAVSEHTYMGFAIQEFVPGTTELFIEGVVDINPGDAMKVNISDGDDVLVSSTLFNRTWRARLVEDQPLGSLSATLDGPDTDGLRTLHVNIRKNDV